MQASSSGSPSSAPSAARRNSLLIVSYNFPPQLGGIEQVCVQLARALHRAGIEVHVVAKDQPAASKFDADEPYTIHRYRGADLGLSRVLSGLLRQGYQRVLCMQWTSAIWLAGLRSLVGSPQVLAVLVHGKELYPSPRSPFPAAWQRAALLRVLSAASHLLPNSAFTAELLGQCASHPNVQRLTFGVEASRFVAPDRAATQHWRRGRPGPFVSTLGRLVPRKGVDTLLRALPLLSARHPSVQCLVAGDGPDASRLVRLAAELGVSAHVEFVGRVPEERLNALYAASDVFALLSRVEQGGNDVEGFGLVLLEAQAAGCPVITTREGGMRDAIVPDVTGLLVDARDPAEFAAHAGALLADAERLRAMSLAAQAHAKTQTWDATARQLLAAIAEA